MLANADDLVSQLPSTLSLISSQPTSRFTKEDHFVFKESEFDPEKISAAHSQRLTELKDITADPNIDLVFFHLPIPHAPVQYNRFTKEFTPERQDYINNIALCDIILGEIRKSMEQANEWDNSTIIISSDHQWRINSWKEQSTSARLALTDGDRQLTKEIEDPRVPFFIKLKNQNEPITYDKPFNTVITRDLILTIIKGEISTPEELKNRMDVLNK
jgi:arylsulfatase A-like enzyme